MKLPKIQWPTAAVVCVLWVTLAAVFVLVPEHRTEIMAGVATIGSLALAVMRPMLGAPAAPAPAPRPRRERETDPPPPGNA